MSRHRRLIESYRPVKINKSANETTDDQIGTPGRRIEISWYLSRDKCKLLFDLSSVIAQTYT